MKALLIAGDRSGSGKTSITLGIASLLSRHHTVQTFKVGMDYIDPSYLAAASGRPCRNLDGYVMSPAEIRQIVDHAVKGADLMLVEGVRGLYEGADAISDEGSSAEIAKLLDIPVILVVNARSITRSAAALVKGFMAFDPGIRICGVILNNIYGTSHLVKAERAIEHHCGIPVLGALPHIPEMGLEMRHLGLVPYREGEMSTAFRETVGRIQTVIDTHVEVEQLLTCAGEYAPSTNDMGPFTPREDPDVRVGIAFDEAFNFYYADLVDVLRGCGAECTFFSPIHDRLPELDGYILGGGYPELYARDLEANGSMRHAVQTKAAERVPFYAECGGLIYLTDCLTLAAGWRGGEREISYEMAGVVHGVTQMPARRVVSYVEGRSCDESPLGGGSFRGHEFHYSDVILDPKTRFCYQLSRGGGIRDGKDGALVHRTLASYTHLAPLPARSFLSRFVDQCRGHP